MVDPPPSVSDAADEPAHESEPVGWRSAVAMLRANLSPLEVTRALAREFDLTGDEAARATAFAEAWLSAARRGH